MDAGFSPLLALETATLSPAVYLASDHELGTVAAGKLANLNLPEANPLEVIRNTTSIRTVMVRGEAFDSAALL